jgi:hypothetical protein
LEAVVSLVVTPSSRNPGSGQRDEQMKPADIETEFFFFESCALHKLLIVFFVCGNTRSSKKMLGAPEMHVLRPPTLSDHFFIFFPLMSAPVRA